MFTPLVLFIAGITLVVVILIIAALSVHYYFKAKEIAPYLMLMEEIQRRIAEAQMTLSETKEEIKGLENNLANARRIIADGEAARKWLEENGSKIEALKVATDTAKQQLKDADEAYEKRLKELNDLTQQVADKNIELKNVQIKKDAIDIAVAQSESQLASLKLEIETNGRLATQLHGEIEQMLKDKLELEQQVAMSRNDLNRLLGELSEKKAQLLDAKKDLETLNYKKEEAERKLAETTGKKNALDSDIPLSERRLASLATDIKSSTEQAKLLHEEIDGLNKQKCELEPKVNESRHSLDDMQQKLDEKKAQLLDAKKELGLLDKEKAIAQGEANAATQILSELDKRRENNAECWKDLDAPVVIEKKPARSNLNELVWLESFNEKLRKHQILFNPRTIKAFHTGLKCGEESALVVLSGISGTGKSLLPELYAASLGMNFLPVAVQPRWDSPQDMFGFYNYMEGRYKATELSRLLWQMDKYNNQVAKELYAEQCPINLVLLDEMNLARVEYYFSDLLSKLEMRHGLDSNDKSSRRKVEIEIECNASGVEEQRRRLFVGTNILFVGTMNEDESTQTLSDKVIDRSNVLRFGRPEQLGMKPEKAEFLQSFTSNAITALNWKQWQCRNESRVVEMKRRFEPLNQELDKIGRPFAHRAWHAMESYVAYYPGDSDADSHAAFSDQVEMKILPKLNGIELDVSGFEQVKNTLQNLIDGLDDEKLSNAFRASCNPTNNSFFKWRGVMR